ncbi:Exported zinc metalloprotease YfgC precursor [Salmonella enterica subsp. enterica]|uniref:Exported zinc metalloprotease YfgC n=1 Tax=Salmonella enterica I TaxID=59201 RepID=A0A379WPB0_SALET|nr:Exported zinc metalloprotease YfgC precursor [Salmonella enterica subsp. enterica]
MRTSKGGQPKAAETILNRYTFSHKDDGNGWDLLAQAEAALNNRDQELAARAEKLCAGGTTGSGNFTAQ